MVDKKALLELSVEDRLTTLHNMPPEELKALILNDDGSYDEVFIHSVAEEIRGNREFVTKLQVEAHEKQLTEAREQNFKDSNG